MKKLSLALIGLGKWGEQHLINLKELEKKGLCKLSYVADVNKTRLDEICSKYKLEGTTDFHSFLDDKELKAVDVVTPAGTHYEICKDCLEAGKDVFVEKPITLDLGEAERLIRLTDKLGKILMVGFIFRYNSVVWEIKKEIKNGNLGEIYYLYGHFIGIKNLRTDCGVTMSDGVHYVDLFNYLLDALPKEVLGVTQHFLKAPFDDMGIIMLNYGTTLAYVETSCLPPRKLRDLIVVGSKKSIVADLLDQKMEIRDASVERVGERFLAQERGVTKPRIKFQNSLQLELADFIKCANERTKPQSDSRAGYNALKIVDAAFKSAKTKAAVKL